MKSSSAEEAAHRLLKDHGYTTLRTFPLRPFEVANAEGASCYVAHMEEEEGVAFGLSSGGTLEMTVAAALPLPEQRYALAVLWGSLLWGEGHYPEKEEFGFVLPRTALFGTLRYNHEAFGRAFADELLLPRAFFEKGASIGMSAEQLALLFGVPEAVALRRLRGLSS